MMNQKDFYTLLKSIPKAELHIHIEAVPTINTIKTLYQKKNNKEMTDEEVESLFKYEDLNGFVDSFLKVQDLYTSVDDLNYIFDDLEKYLVENHIVYTEAFFSPTSFLKKGFSFKQMTELFSRRIGEIKTNHNITVKLIMDVSRTYGVENAKNNYKLLKANPCKDIIGIGLGGTESKGPCKDYASIFEEAKKDGYHVVCHAGEDLGSDSIWDAINILKAERIGHAVSAIQDDKLVEELKERQIPIEVCLTSNLFTKKFATKASEHPVHDLYDKGVMVTVNTDDPVFFKTNLIEEYWKFYNDLDFRMKQIEVLMANGFKASFISSAEKELWIEKLREVFGAVEK